MMRNTLYSVTLIPLYFFIFVMPTSAQTAHPKITSARPQEPKTPIPYRSGEVHYENSSVPGLTNAGTLKLPEGKGKFPAVLFIGGSGRFPRDQPYYGHKMPMVLADYLKRRGIAVLRFDDRGADESTLDTKAIKDLTMEDFVSDIRAGISFLQNYPEIDTTLIGIIGTSKKMATAQIIAAGSFDEIAFIVLLAPGSGTKGETIAAQSEVMARVAGYSNQAQKADREFVQRSLIVLRSEPDQKKRLEKMSAIADRAVANIPEKKRKSVEPGIRTRVKILASENFYQEAIARPRDYLREVRHPVLALIPSKDMMVSAEKTVPRLLASLKKAKNKDF